MPCQHCEYCTSRAHVPSAVQPSCRTWYSTPYPCRCSLRQPPLYSLLPSAAKSRASGLLWVSRRHRPSLMSCCCTQVAVTHPPEQGAQFQHTTFNPAPALRTCHKPALQSVAALPLPLAKGAVCVCQTSLACREQGTALRCCTAMYCPAQCSTRQRPTSEHGSCTTCGQTSPDMTSAAHSPSYLSLFGK